VIEADAGADAALSGQPLSQPLRSAPQHAPAPYDKTQFTLPPLPSGYTLAANKAIAAFRIESDPIKMAALESPAQAALTARDTAKAAVPAANPAHAAFATAVTDQDAHLVAARNVLAKRQAQAAAAAVTAAAKNPQARAASGCRRSSTS
jgi:hypothetical protein